MKRIGALKGILAALAVGVCALQATAQKIEFDFSSGINPAEFEINPAEYVPLAVGNRWTYKQNYYSTLRYPFESDYGYLGLTLEDIKPLLIPEFPYGPDNPPPDSLLVIENKPLTIEITHTEQIDGLDYFVFSGPEYDWPPMPDLFWAGKKVRLSEDGKLIFRWNGQDIPVYDLDGPYTNLSASDLSSLVTIPGVDPTLFGVRRRYLQFYKLSGTSTRLPYILFFFEYKSWDYRYVFVHGYGMGPIATDIFWTSTSPVYINDLAPVSATIDGEEISYEWPEPTAVQPTSWGALKNNFLHKTK